MFHFILLFQVRSRFPLAMSHGVVGETVLRGKILYWELVTGPYLVPLRSFVARVKAVISLCTLPPWSNEGLTLDDFLFKPVSLQCLLNRSQVSWYLLPSLFSAISDFHCRYYQFHKFWWLSVVNGLLYRAHLLYGSLFFHSGMYISCHCSLQHRWTYQI